MLFFWSSSRRNHILLSGLNVDGMLMAKSLNDNRANATKLIEGLTDFEWISPASRR
jgi:hypothetical protein